MKICSCQFGVSGRSMSKGLEDFWQQPKPQIAISSPIPWSKSEQNLLVRFELRDLGSGSSHISLVFSAPLARDPTPIEASATSAASALNLVAPPSNASKMVTSLPYESHVRIWKPIRKFHQRWAISVR